MTRAVPLVLLLTSFFSLLVFSSRDSMTISAATIGDATRGKVLFEKRCTGCHSLDQDKEGPHLRNVYGRKAGSVKIFPYSAALLSSKVTWDDVSLEKWLTEPDSLVPGNDMAFQVPKPGERADIIQFLKVTSEKQ